MAKIAAAAATAIAVAAAAAAAAAEAPRNTEDVDERTTAAASNRTDGKDGGGEQKQTVECRDRKSVV